VIERLCPDDLFAIARRRVLSDLERQALSAHLARCELCRAGEVAGDLLHDPHRIDGRSTLQRDRELVDRVAEVVSVSFTRSTRPRPARLRQIAVAATLVVCVGSAAFAWIGRWPAIRSKAAVPPPAAENRPHANAGNAGKVAPSAAPPAPAASLAPRKRLLSRVGREPASATDPPQTAASLFAQAISERRNGDLKQAVALYETLRLRFPESGEAHLSSISLGDLLIRMDEPARALRAFDSYLAKDVSGRLREEAMFGRARCLRELGERRYEQQTWDRLLRILLHAHGFGIRRRTPAYG